MTPVQFLTARLDEREALARDAIRDPADSDDGTDDDGRWQVATFAVMDACRVEGIGIEIYDEGGHTEEQAAFIAAHDPAYVLADIAAKRAIIDAYHSAVARCAAEPEWGDGLCDLTFYALRGVVTTLCLAFADHPDYQLLDRIERQQPDNPVAAPDR